MYRKAIKIILTSLLVSSCSTNLSIDNKIHKQNSEIRVDDGTLSKKVNINFNTTFSIKDISHGQLEKTFSDIHHIKLIISKDFSSPFNQITSSIDISPSTTNFEFTLNGLKTNTNYYIAARVYNSNFETEDNNIAEGGTIISNEYVNIDSQGRLSIINDNGNNKIDITIKLKNRIGVKIDTNVRVSEGTLGSFAIISPMRIYSGSSSSLYEPKTIVNNKGDGFILWREVGIENYIKGLILKDYEVNTDPITFHNTSLNISNFSFDTKNNGDGILVWSRELNNPSDPYHIFYKEVKNNFPFGSETRLDTNNDTDTLSKPLIKINHNDNNVVSAWILNNQEFCLRASSLSPISWGSQFTSSISPLKVLDFDISKPNNSGEFFMFSIVENIPNTRLELTKFSIDGSFNITGPLQNINITNYNGVPKFEPKIYLNNEGNGMICWIESNVSNYILYAKRIFNYLPSSELIEIASSVNPINNLNLSLNNNGNGIISWIDNGDINIEKIVNFSLSYHKYVITSSSQALNSFVNIDNKGILVSSDNNNINYNRILDNIIQ